MSSGQYIRLSLDLGSRVHLFSISQLWVIRSADSVLKRKVKREMKGRSGSGRGGGDRPRPRGRGWSRNAKNKSEHDHTCHLQQPHIVLSTCLNFSTLIALFTSPRHCHFAVIFLFALSFLSVTFSLSSLSIPFHSIILSDDVSITGVLFE